MSFNYSQPFMSWAANGLNTMQGSTGIGGWVELGRVSATAGSNLDLTSISDKRYYMLLHSRTALSASSFEEALINNDSGTSYASRGSEDGGADFTRTSQTDQNYIESGMAGTTPVFSVGYASNLSTNEKLFQLHNVAQNTAGAATAPKRAENVFKWVNTSSALNRITLTPQTGNITGELVVLGWDPADTHTNNFWAELASVTAGGASTNISSGTITAKKYLWVQAWLESTSAHVTNMTFNNDTTTYAYRNSDNGAADGTSTSDSHIEIHQSTSTGIFVNMFIINNSANEKLVIGHTVGQSTAGATTAPIRREFVGKYDNTAAQITEIDLDSSSGNWSSNSIIKVWGAD